jgi:hypothetical protein
LVFIGTVTGASVVVASLVVSPVVVDDSTVESTVATSFSPPQAAMKDSADNVAIVLKGIRIRPSCRARAWKVVTVR